MKQESIFLGGEGDAWYGRNRDALLEGGKEDWPVNIIERNNLTPERVLELGCSNGWRLAKLQGRSNCLVGLDASTAAIEDGQKLYPELELIRGGVSSVPINEPFNLIIVNFVLHWVDRDKLARTISEIDRLLEDGGMLIIGDFWPSEPARRKYHHLPQEDVWTWKQDYAQAFQSLGIYHKIDAQMYQHEKPTVGQVESGTSRAVCVLLQKDSSRGYEVEN